MRITKLISLISQISLVSVNDMCHCVIGARGWLVKSLLRNESDIKF